MKSSLEKINIGFIGSGRIADLHYNAYQKIPNARVYAVCDSNREALEARKSQWNAVKYYSDYREMLLDAEVDAVEILSPHSLHEEMAVEAAKAGKHIAVQKPMTISLASADRMLAAAANRSIIFKITENYIFYPPIALAKKMIDNGEIGEPLLVRVKCVSGASGGWKVPASAWEWRMKEMMEGRGAATFDHGHHIWSTVRHLLGEVEKVSAWIDRSNSVMDCPAVAILKFRDGAKYGECDFTHAADLHIPSNYYANDEWFEITGSKGIIFINRCTGNIHSGPVMSVFDGNAMKHIDDIESDWSAGFNAAAKNFVDSISGDASPKLSGKEGREVLRLALAVQKASRVGREVYTDELDSAWPWLYALTKQFQNAARNNSSKPSLSFFGENLSKYAAQARPLTEKLINSLDPSSIAGWDIAIGMHLTEDGGVAEEKLGLIIRDGKAEIQSGSLPIDAKLSVKVPAGVWAAILMKKKRAEVAFLQGKIKVEGQIEEGLKLRTIFKL